MSINNVTLNREISHYANASASRTNTESKQIQNQIANKQQRLNQLSSDQQMSAQEKAKERQEIQQQIAELNRKLQLLRQEQKEEVSKAKKEEEQKIILKEELLSETTKTEDRELNEKAKHEADSDIEKAPFKNMKGMLAADFLMQKEQIQERVAQIQEGAENVLQSEIKLDELRGDDTSAKKEQLQDLRKKDTIQIDVPQQEKPSHVGINDGAKIIIRE